MIAVIIVLFIIAIIIVDELSKYVPSKVYKTSLYRGGSDKIEIISSVKTSSDAQSMIKKMINLFNGKKLDLIRTYDEIPEAHHIENLNIVKGGCHSGQRKLLLTEIQFITKFGGTPLLIYAGSAPCEHISVLLEMYPDLKFLLIDPNYHGIKEPYKYIYQNFSSISHHNRKGYKRDTENKSDHKRYIHAKQLKMAKFWNGESHNVIDDSTETQFKMDKIMKEFKNTSVNLVSDIMEGEDRIYIIQDYMSGELSDTIKKSLIKAGNPKFVFVSDIRTNIMSNSGPTDLDFIWNDALQMIFLQKLQPEYSMLKFHPPLHYSDDVSIKLFNTKKMDPMWYKIIKHDLDFVKKQYGADPLSQYKDEKYPYLKHETIHLQAWGTSGGTEARLIISKDNLKQPLINYDYKEWFNKYAYMRLMRGYAYYDKYYSMVKDLTDEYDGCFDCALEMDIIASYLAKYKSLTPDALVEYKRKLDDVLLYQVDKKCGLHGQLTEVPNGLNYYIYNIIDLYKMTYRTFKVKLKGDKLIYIPHQGRYDISDNLKSDDPDQNQKINALILKSVRMYRDYYKKIKEMCNILK